MFDDYGLTEEQLAMQTLAREFSEKHIKPIAAKIDRMEVQKTEKGKVVAESFPWDMVKEAHKLGFKTLIMPREYGGVEADPLTYAIVVEEMAYVDSTCSKILSQQKIPMGIVDYGTKDQKDRFLGAFRDNPTYLIAGANTEPDSDKTLFGSPEGGPMLAVTKKRDGYVLNGTKHFIAIGGVADLVIVRGRTDKTVPPSKGLSSFLVPWGTPGFARAKIHDKIGWRAYANAELTFEDVFVPKENLLGEKENFDTAAGGTLLYGNVELAANATGISRAAFDAALEHAKQRVQGGKPIIQHQIIGCLLAEMYMDIQALRSLVWHTARVASINKKIDRKLDLACAWFARKTVLKVTQDALSIFGGYGVMKELPMERYVRDAQIFMHLAGNPQRLATIGYLLGGLDADGKPR